MADEDMHTPAIHDRNAFHFSFFWVINAGSLSKSGNSLQQKKKTEKKICKIRVIAKIHKQIQNIKRFFMCVLCHVFELCFYVHITW